MHPTIKLMSVAALVALGGCAADTASRIGDAATTPLSDLGIKRADIPSVLSKARQNPYLMPAAQSCVAIAIELHELDEVLGPDFDAPASGGKMTFMDKASGVASDQAVGAIQRTAEDLVPFRGWVRKLSGAERHSKHVSECLLAGAARRAFLKGMSAAQHCVPDAVPATLTKS
jgi:hypothetical protein